MVTRRGVLSVAVTAYRALPQMKANPPCPSRVAIFTLGPAGCAKVGETARRGMRRGTRFDLNQSDDNSGRHNKRRQTRDVGL